MRWAYVVEKKGKYIVGRYCEVGLERLKHLSVGSNMAIAIEHDCDCGRCNGQTIYCMHAACFVASLCSVPKFKQNRSCMNLMILNQTQS